MKLVPVEIIKKKRANEPLNREEIEGFVEGFTSGAIPDYQVASWLMAVFLNGLNSNESSYLTGAMLNSGDVLDFSEITATKVDKHSTGGVGDKTSLILAPLVAAAGVSVPMISGRGLGHTGGTLDKLESIPGFTTQLNLDEFRKVLTDIGVSMIGQTAEICPADKKLYALRDVTGTVESLPLICSSIMSKKIAEGIDGLVLDVKFGSGAFMKTLDDARDLAKALVNIGEHYNKRVHALLTSMEQPLGRFIGNSLEVEECLALMKREEIYGCSLEELKDTEDLTLALAGHMIFLGNKASSAEEGIEKAKQLLDSGAAMKKFEEICTSHRGTLTKLPKANEKHTVTATESGYINSFNTEQIGMSALLLGAGRLSQDDIIDPVAGIQLHAKLGDEVSEGAPLFTLYSSTTKNFNSAEERLLKATGISLQNSPAPSLIAETFQ